MLADGVHAPAAAGKLGKEVALAAASLAEARRGAWTRAMLGHCEAERTQDITYSNPSQFWHTF